MKLIQAIIAESILAALKAGNFAIVRNTDTTFADDERDRIFAADVAANASMAIEGAAMDEELDSNHIGGEWSPSQFARKAS